VGKLLKGVFFWETEVEMRGFSTQVVVVVVVMVVVLVA
jgi:hypothetical protein